MATATQHTANVKQIASVGSALISIFIAAPVLGLGVFVIGMVGLCVWTAVFG